MQIIRRIGTGQIAAYMGEAPPSNPVRGMLWIDTSGGDLVLKIYDGENWRVVQTEVALDLETVDGGNL
jgi:hypothetical protein